MTKKTFRVIFKESFIVYVENWLLFGKLFFWLGAYLFFMDWLVWSFEGTKMFLGQLSPFLIFYFRILSVVILTSFFSICSIALLKVVQAIEEGKHVKIVDFYQQAIEIFPSFIYVNILVLFKIFLYFLLFIFPGIFAGIFYSLSPMVLLMEGKKGGEALAYSKKIVKFNFNKYLDYLLFMFVIVAGIFSAMMKVTNFAIISFYETENVVLASLFVVLEYIVGMYTFIFMLVFYYYLYKELKNRQVGCCND